MATAGLSSGINVVNNTCGNAVLQLANALQTVTGLNALLNDAQRVGGQAGLEAAGMDTTDAGLLIASFADLANLHLIARAQLAQPAVSDFFFHAKQLLGSQPMPW